MGGLVSMIAIWHSPVHDCRCDSSLMEPTMSSTTGPPLLTSAPCLARVRDGTGGRAARRAAGDHGRLCGFADRIHFASPRQNGAAAFMDRSVLNDKSAPFQRKAK